MSDRCFAVFEMYFQAPTNYHDTNWQEFSSQAPSSNFAVFFLFSFFFLFSLFFFLFFLLKKNHKNPKQINTTTHPPQQTNEQTKTQTKNKETNPHFTRTNICKFVYYPASGTMWLWGAGHSCVAQDPECKHSPASVLTFQELWQHSHL